MTTEKTVEQMAREKAINMLVAEMNSAKESDKRVGIANVILGHVPAK